MQAELNHVGCSSQCEMYLKVVLIFIYYKGYVLHSGSLSRL